MERIPRNGLARDDFRFIRYDPNSTGSSVGCSGRKGIGVSCAHFYIDVSVDL